MSKDRLSFPRIPINVIINAPGMNIFWQRFQINLNSFLNDIHVKGWDTVLIMHIEVDDDKVHLNQKIATDDFRRARNARKNRVNLLVMF